MATYIVSLDRFGHRLYQAVVNYCQVTGHERDPGRYKHIYDQCLSQLLHVMSDDMQDYSIALLSLPDWRTIHFLDSPINYELVMPFRDELRAIGLMLWQKIKSVNALEPSSYRIFYSATLDIVIFTSYADATYM